MRLQGTLFERRGIYGTKVESQFDVDWTEEAVRQAFGDEIVQVKEQQRLWSATRYKEGSTRGAAGLLGVGAAVLDFDCCDVGDMDEILDHTLKLGLAVMLYSSWSHGRQDKVHDDTQIIGPFDCFRLVLPYSREVTPAEHTSIVDALLGFEVLDTCEKYRKEAVARVVTLHNGKERMAKPRGWDPTCNSPSRGYFQPLPTSIFELHQGAPLDVDEILNRPTTSRPSTRKLRPYQAPAPSALGALGILERALDKLGLFLSGETAGGWRRSTCPHCMDPSPSLTVRANGDGIDLKCHAGCARSEVLSSLDLFGAVWDPPSSLKIDFELQLDAQRPQTDAIPVDAAATRLRADILAAVKSGKRTVIKSPAGVGKSYASASVMAELVREGERICYATQEHAVAHETRSKLPPDVRERSVHIHSPLIQVAGGPVCRRADEVKGQVFEYGVSLQGSICPRCPFRDECDALKEAQARTERLKTASVIFCSHAGIRQVFGHDQDGRRKGLGVKLICDEMPTVYERVHVSALGLSLLKNALLQSCAPIVTRVVQEVARAILAGEEPGEVSAGPGGETLSAADCAAEWGRVVVRDGAHPSPAEKALLVAADNLLRLTAHAAEGHEIEGLDEPEKDGISAMLPDGCHQALLETNGVLLSATPMMAALEGFDLVAQEVQDGAPVRRVAVLRARGSRAMFESFYDDALGARERRDRQPGEAPGIPWPAVDEALARALHEADRYGPEANVLFVTFKELADLLRSDPDRLAGGRVKIGHYGALRGKNDWEESKPDACQVCYCFGTPRFNIFSMFEHLGLYGEAASEAWIEQAAGELAQAEGRLRIPRRKTPCTVIVEGDVAPSTWHPDNVEQVITDPDRYETMSGLLEGALVWMTLDQLAEELGLDESTVRRWRQPGRPAPQECYRERLRALSRPRGGEAMRLLSRMPGARRRRFQQDFSWRPLDGE